jgi:hypothetical protein
MPSECHIRMRSSGTFFNEYLYVLLFHKRVTVSLLNKTRLQRIFRYVKQNFLMAFFKNLILSLIQSQNNKEWGSELEIQILATFVESVFLNPILFAICIYRFRKLV